MMLKAVLKEKVNTCFHVFHCEPEKVLGNLVWNPYWISSVWKPNKAGHASHPDSATEASRDALQVTGGIKTRGPQYMNAQNNRKEIHAYSEIPFSLLVTKPKKKKKKKKKGKKKVKEKVNLFVNHLWLFSSYLQTTSMRLPTGTVRSLRRHRDEKRLFPNKKTIKKHTKVSSLRVKGGKTGWTEKEKKKQERDTKSCIRVEVGKTKKKYLRLHLRHYW